MLKKQRPPTPPVAWVSPTPVDPRLAQRHAEVVDEAAKDYVAKHGLGAAKKAVERGGVEALTKSPRKRKVMARRKAAREGEQLFPLGGDGPQPPTGARVCSTFKQSGSSKRLKHRTRSEPIGFAPRSFPRGGSPSPGGGSPFLGGGSPFLGGGSPFLDEASLFLRSNTLRRGSGGEKSPPLRGVITPPHPDGRDVLGSSVVSPEAIPEDEGTEDDPSTQA
jgi:hypothetical protein